MKLVVCCTLTLLSHWTCLAAPERFEAADTLTDLIAQFERLEAEAGPLRNKKRRIGKIVKDDIDPVLAKIALVGNDRSLAFLNEQLQHSIQAIRKSAIKAMAKVEDERAAKLLLESVRSEPRFGQGQKKPDRARDHNDAVIDGLASLVSADGRRWIAGKAFRKASKEQLRVLCIVVERGDLKAGDQLVKLVRHRHAVIANAALSALAATGIGPYTETVGKLSIDELDRDVRIAVLDAFARAQQEAALELVIRATVSKDSDTRTIALGSLGLRPKSRMALDGVLVGLRDESPQVVAAALDAIAKFRFKEIVPALILSLERLPTERLRVDALATLTELTDQNMGMSVADWSGWWELAEKEFAFGVQKGGGTNVKRRGLEYFGLEVRSKRAIFLIDYSLSMNKAPGRAEPSAETPSKLEVVKRELVGLLEQLPSDAAINLVLFHAKPVPWKNRLTLLTSANRKSAIEFVADGKPEFGTNIYDTLALALDDPHVDTIYLLSDGLPVGGTIQNPGEIRRAIRNKNRVRKVKIFTIGLGAGEGFLKKIARENGGKCRILTGKKKT